MQDQAKKFEEVLGEAYFLRGLSYFLFGTHVW